MGMRVALGLLLAVFATGNLALEWDPKCAWGQSYWCSDLRTAKACGAIGHCSATVWTNQILKQDGSEICQFCTSVIDGVREYIEKKKTQEEIARFMNLACGIIPKLSIANQCTAVVKDMTADIVQLVSAKIDPQVICGLMKVCRGLEDLVAHSAIAPSAQGPSRGQPLVGDSGNMISGPLSSQAEPICSDCQKFFKDVKDLIISNQTQAEVELMIDSVICAMLGSFESQCRTIVHEMTPEIMAYLSSYYDPAVICQSLGVCGGGGDRRAPESIAALVRALTRGLPQYHAEQQGGSSLPCAICKTGLGELQLLTRNKAVQAEILNLISTQICTRLIAYNDSCIFGVQYYSSALFLILDAELDPSKRCARFGVCPAPHPSQMAPRLPLTPLFPANSKLAPAVSPKVVPLSKQAGKLKVGQSTECVVCEFMMKELKSLISTNASEAQIVTALEKVCDLLPATLATPCHSIVEVYGQQIVDMIIAGMDANQICTNLGLCDPPSTGNKAPPTSRPPRATNPPPAIADAQTCMVCETVVQYLESMLEQNASRVEIAALLRSVCYAIPALERQCDAFVEKYESVIIQYISTLANPKEVCTLIGVCVADKRVGGVEDVGVVGLKAEEKEVKQKVVLVGENECTWGPSFWCINRANAEKCGAVDHCKKYVWSQ